MFPTTPADISSHLNLTTTIPAVNPQTLTPQTSPPSATSDSDVPEPRLAEQEPTESPWVVGEACPDSSATLLAHTPPDFKDAASHASTSKVSAADSFEEPIAAALSVDHIVPFYEGQTFKVGTEAEKDLQQSFHWHIQAAEQGHATAQFNVGFLYEYGYGVNTDERQAFIWYRKAAEQGQADAQIALGDAYWMGQGVEADAKQAFIWYRKAAEQGKFEAQLFVGDRYKNGEGVKADDAEAFNWFYKAAQNGAYIAKFNLASAYLLGSGVKRDMLLGTSWLLNAGLCSDGERINLFCDDDCKNIFGEVISHIPKVLDKFPEFQQVIALNLYSPLGNDEFSVLIDMIRSNPPLQMLNLSAQLIDNERALMLADSFQFNNTLTELIIHDDDEVEVEDDEEDEDEDEEGDDDEDFAVDKNLLDQIAASLAQNVMIAELRDYMKRHPASRSDHLPKEVLHMMVDELIVTASKAGQSKAATIAAIDEFLLSASRESLIAENIIND